MFATSAMLIGFFRRARRPGAVLIVAAIALQAVINGGSAFERAPGLDVSHVVDADVAMAVRSAYNLPAWIEGEGAPERIPREDLAAMIEIEKARLTALMISLGYLDAEVVVDGKQSPAQLTLLPVTHQRYRVGTIEVIGLHEAELGQETIADIGSIVPSFTGQVATTDLLSRLEGSIIFRIAAKRPLAKIAHREVVGEPSTVLADVTLSVDSGPAARFGNVTTSGLRRTRANTLQQLIPFVPGDPYDRGKLDVLRQNLEELGLFSRVRVSTDQALDEKGLLPVRVQVAEKPVDIAQLSRSGANGLAIAMLTLFALALRQVGLSGGSSPFVVRATSLVSLSMILAFAVFGTQRLLLFL